MRSRVSPGTRAPWIPALFSSGVTHNLVSSRLPTYVLSEHPCRWVTPGMEERTIEPWGQQLLRRGCCFQVKHEPWLQGVGSGWKMRREIPGLLVGEVKAVWPNRQAFFCGGGGGGVF